MNDLPLWTVGLAVTIISPLISLVAKQTFLYWLVYNILVWTLIGAIYLVENITLSKRRKNENRNNI